MSWTTIDPRVQDIAQTVLTDKQRQVFILLLAGYDDRRISEATGKARGTIRDHAAAVYRNLRNAGVKFHPNGEPYLDGE